MRYSLAIFVILCVLPTLADAPAKLQPADIELAVSENNVLTLTARKGQTVRLRLEGNATTGYEWTLVSQTDAKGNAREILSAVGKIEYQPAPADGRMGAGGEFLAAFRAEKPGLAKLAFAYKRPWEKDKAPDRTFAIFVRVPAEGSDGKK
ncbi:MAG: protease inhibitor I42 family protein [Phycisphaerae bacterium]|nr:protease inhibitor I42 family protein [Phycisphaerae bacterium]